MMPQLFDLVQKLFNGNLWGVFQTKFARYDHGRVIDLACGTGELRNYIHPKYYIGVDINPIYIEYAKKRFPKAETEFLVADITHRLPDGEYDTAFFISAAHHLSDKHLHQLFLILSKSKITTLVIIDDIPIGPLAKVLSFLDAKLGKGDYFRTKEQLYQIAKKYFQITHRGCFSARFSFYRYPYLIARILKHKP